MVWDRKGPGLTLVSLGFDAELWTESESDDVGMAGRERNGNVKDAIND